MIDITEQDVRKALSQVNHPVIDGNIVELGIIRNITIKKDTAAITMAFPFIGAATRHIALRNQIINDVKQLVENLGLKFKLKQAEMIPEEFKAFLAIENERWKDIV